MFTSASCVAIGVLQEGEKLEDKNNAVDVSDAPLVKITESELSFFLFSYSHFHFF